MPVRALSIGEIVIAKVITLPTSSNIQFYIRDIMGTFVV